MLKENPVLYEYLKTRRFSNKTGKHFGYEPHDELHEEYNKRGMSFGPNKTIEEMKTSFAVADPYRAMRDAVFKEYQVTANNEYLYKTLDYEENIFKMRLKMRSQAYLTEPSNKNELKSFGGEKLDKKLFELKNLD